MCIHTPEGPFQGVNCLPSCKSLNALINVKDIKMGRKDFVLGRMYLDCVVSTTVRPSVRTIGLPHNVNLVSRWINAFKD